MAEVVEAVTPILYTDDEKRFVSMGLGGMSEARSCRVLWKCNGLYELEMEYPVSGRRFADLKGRRIILASVGPDEEPQPFRIYHIRKPILGLVKIYARHVVYDLMGHTLRPFAAAGLSEALAQLNGGATVQPHGITISSDMVSTAACTVAVPRSVWSMLGGAEGSLLDTYRGEWLFTGYSAILKERLGEDLNVVVRYGKNLQTLEQEENLANTWTGVQPYWYDELEGTLVTLPEEVISAGSFDHVRVRVLDLSAEFEAAPTVEQLRARAQRFIADNHVGEPSVGLDIRFVPLDQTEEYKGRAFLNKIHKGDTVRVEFPTSYDRRTGEPRAFVQTSARAVQSVWLPMKDKYESVRLGSVKADFVDAVAQLQKDVSWVMTQVR